ncbi:hypothetical protein BE11_32420 [Sorangium cellulosum]|nr:hypothetical protein BE11_32420 [Sorangium cellulosum]
MSRSRDDIWNAIHAAATEVLPRLLRRLGGAEADVDDLLQETLLAAHKSLDRFHPDWTPTHREAPSAADPPGLQGQRRRRSPEARWGVGIALHKVSHHLHRAHRRREVPATAALCTIHAPLPRRASPDGFPPGRQRRRRRRPCPHSQRVPIDHPFAPPTDRAAQPAQLILLAGQFRT